MSDTLLPPLKFMDTVVDALGVEMDEADAIVRRATPDHPHVRRVLGMQQEVTEARASAGGSSGVLPSIGLCHTLREADMGRTDARGGATWTNQVRRIIAEVTAKRSMKSAL